MSADLLQISNKDLDYADGIGHLFEEFDVALSLSHTISSTIRMFRMQFAPTKWNVLSQDFLGSAKPLLL